MTTAHEHHHQPLLPDGESLRVPAFKYLFALPRFAYKLWFGIVFFSSLILLYAPFKVMLKRGKLRSAFRLKRAWGRFLSIAGGFPLRAVWKGVLPGPPYVICCNHGSYIDIPQVFNLMPDYFLMMGKYELLRWPLFRIFFKGMDIAVNRGSRMEAARALRHAAEALDRGACIALFPEGTIPDNAPRMKHMKNGAFRLAIEKQVPIVPVTFLNHWKIFGEPTRFLSRGRPGIARAIVHPAVPTGGMTEADLPRLRMKVHAIIEAPLVELYGGKDAPSQRS